VWSQVVFHCGRALKYPWRIPETSTFVFDLNATDNGKGLHCKSTQRLSDFLFQYFQFRSSSVKGSIPYSKFFRLTRLWSDNSDFTVKSGKMSQIFSRVVERGITNESTASGIVCIQTSHYHHVKLNWGTKIDFSYDLNLWSRSRSNSYNKMTLKKQDKKWVNHCTIISICKNYCSLAWSLLS